MLRMQNFQLNDQLGLPVWGLRYQVIYVVVLGKQWDAIIYEELEEWKFIPIQCTP